MKLRLKGNSVRLRLDRRDFEQLINEGRVEDAVRFGPGQMFEYAVQVGPASRGCPMVSYTDGCLTIQINPIDADEWLAPERVGFDHQQPVDGGVVRVLLEKDFACIDRQPGEEVDDVYAFPNPTLSC
jgi:hypothetical protein